ncbi:MAG TPA: hypothetical protein VE553_07015 [Candidatus Binatia bacterium]|jgi:hypothetical protein|nr:hypothetical protein [Candidatus Binatia bacterium]
MSVRKRIKVARVASLAAALLISLLAACGNSGDTAPAGDENAVQLPAEAQQAVAMSQEALASELNVDVVDIELQSIIAPAEADGPYIVRLSAADEVYEFHVQDGQVLRVSRPRPVAPAG